MRWPWGIAVLYVDRVGAAPRVAFRVCGVLGLSLCRMHVVVPDGPFCCPRMHAVARALNPATRAGGSPLTMSASRVLVLVYMVPASSLCSITQVRAVAARPQRGRSPPRRFRAPSWRSPRDGGRTKFRNSSEAAPELRHVHPIRGSRTPRRVCDARSPSPRHAPRHAITSGSKRASSAYARSCAL